MKKERESLFQTLIFLADFHFSVGLIGIDEYGERCQVAIWLATEDGQTPDPREYGNGDLVTSERKGCLPYESQLKIRENADGAESRDWMEFVFGVWVFTKSDPDPYPSTPHGHRGNRDRRWPKLNPYTGRVFRARQQEEVSSRLSRSDLQILWNDERFRDFCRSHVLWFMQEFPHHRFPVTNPLRLPRKR